MDPQQAIHQQQFGYPQEGQTGNRTLYVGNLDPQVTDSLLSHIFSTVGPVIHVKIIPEKNLTGGPSYGFVEMSDPHRAEAAIQALTGRKVYGLEIRVNWAFSNGGNGQKEDTTNHFHIFVGDLCPEVDDQILGKAFSAFGSMSDARVMWDLASKKSRGYGFVAFRHKQDADKAIATMHGEFLGSRAIRVNWANQKGSQPKPTSNITTDNFQTYEQVLSQSSPSNTTVYLGNLPPYTTQDHIIPFFHPYGYIVELRVQADRGFAFVKLSTHEQAASAIVGLQGTPINGRPVKCSWGKDKAAEMSCFQLQQPAAPYGYNPYSHMAPLYGVSPMDYGMPTQGAPDNSAGLSGYEGYGYDYSQYYSIYGSAAAPGAGYPGTYPPGPGQPQDPSAATQ
ncbi:E3 ubiquitin-protein ligase pub1 [Entomophthora muscae]|uniref:E3 ubiquitin-protein ligase pub1 n=1 Tax=Entomophthora muscae TaxID=34485 RepID=A0ACC2T0A1_9FUNG|nr:E3 ubiquitin-protein ligase pub1 [Entomophthora muscae]